MKKDLLSELEKNLPKETQQLAEAVKKADAIEDYEFSREKYRDLISKAEQVIERAMQLAMESEHPSAFEALSTLMNNTTIMIDRLMKLQHSKRDLEKKSEKTDSCQPNLIGGEQPKLQQTNVFVGTPAELQRLIKDGNVTLPTS